MTDKEAKKIIMEIYERQIKDDFKLLIKDETAMKIHVAFIKAAEALSREE